MVQVIESVVIEVLVECSCCEVPTVVREIDEATGECAACVFVGWVEGHEAMLAGVGAVVAEDAKAVA